MNMVNYEQCKDVRMKFLQSHGFREKMYYLLKKPLPDKVRC